MEIKLEKKKSYKGLVGGWSKWGGRRFGALDQDSQIEQDWFCQNCGDWYPAIISPVKVELPEVGYLRICPICYALDKFTDILTRD